MKKWIAVIVVSLLSVLLLVSCGTQETTEPLPKETKLISSVEDLVSLKDYVGVKYKNFVFELTDDIDLSNIDVWTPIGDDLDHAFFATLDGKGHSIKNLKIKGVAADGSPNFVVKDKGVEFVSSFASCGLFGYTSGATIKNLTLSDVDFDYYVDYKGYSYAGGLVGFDYGKSVFSDISVSGNINVNNLYNKYVYYNVDDRESEGDLKDECTSSLLLGGVVAYSQGGATFSDVESTVSFENNRYVAYYRTKDNAGSLSEEELESFVEGYEVEYQTQNFEAKVDRIIAGGVVGQIKGGSLFRVEYNGYLTFDACNVYAGGIAGVTYGATMTDLSVNGLMLTSYVVKKNLIGGLIANIDDGSSLLSSSVSESFLYALQRGTAQKITVGGAFGCLASLSKADDVTVTGVIVNVPIKTATVGGIGGIARDATLKNALASDIHVIIGDTKDNGDRLGTVLGEAEGNTFVSDTHATATVRLDKSGSATRDLTVAVAMTSDFSYYNEDGKPAIRFYRTGKNATFVTVEGKIDGNVLTVVIYNEELSELFTATYTFDEALEPSDNPALTYIDAYFEQGVGFKDDDFGTVTVEGRDFTQYEFRRGAVVLDNVDTVLPE